MKPVSSRFVQFLELSLQAGGWSLEAELGASREQHAGSPSRALPRNPRIAPAFLGVNLSLEV